MVIEYDKSISSSVAQKQIVIQDLLAAENPHGKKAFNYVYVLTYQYLTSK